MVIVKDRTGLKITKVDVEDVRFPTSLGSHGSDSMHRDPDYSAVYVTIKTNGNHIGYGMTFTIGRGTEIVVLACKVLREFLINKNAADIFNDFATFWKEISNDSQLRWVGPEKGVTHLGVAAIVNALWDLWARLEKKPVWKLLADLEPEELVSTIDFRYITDVLTKEEAIEILKEGKKGRKEREQILMKNGYPAYTTQVGWLGYTDEVMNQLLKKYLDMGFTSFKMKVGLNFDDDYRRCKTVRKAIGDKNHLMVDANQIWDVNTAIKWMTRLSEFKPMWIEEPTSPDDILGHATISKALKPYGIGVATGEMCCNRVMFKQFLQADAMQFCQIDAARIGGINEILSVYLMAKKLNVKVVPHAGGVGLCEMVQHLQMWDYLSVSCTIEGRIIEYVDQQHEHLVAPTIVKNARYMPPMDPGYSIEFKKESLEMFAYPHGTEWQRMFKEGIFTPPPKY